jgi:hypothetical protein
VGNLRFDWRWLIAIVVLVALTNSARLPWPVTVLIVGAGGVWLLLIGWRVWVREGGPPRRGPALPRMRDIGPAALYLILGGVLLLAALAIALRNLGI